MKKHLFFLFFSFLFFTSCKTLELFHFALQGKDLIKITTIGTDTIDLKALDKVQLKGFSISDYSHPLVQKHVRNYVLYGKPILEKVLVRGSQYLPMIESVFKANGIPLDLSYLPIIESGFNPFAHSPAGAKGIWQFIYNTGILYKLKADYWHDDRQDVYRSTVAAAYHLKYLYKNLGDWLLVLAAYNAGLGKISTAIKRYGTTNYWELIKYDYIKPETKNYVPKFIAATIIAKNTKKYDIQFQKKPLPELVSYLVEDATEIALLAKAANISLKEFKSYNTSLTQWITPPSKRYPVYIPKDKLTTFKNNFFQIPLTERVTFRTYFVQVGDNLTKISKRFNIPINPIAEINKFTTLNDIFAGRNIIIPIRGLKKAKAHDKKNTNDENQGENLAILSNVFIYVLDDRETLYDVAVKFKISLTKIMEWNNLKSVFALQKNQMLIIKKLSNNLQ